MNGVLQLFAPLRYKPIKLGLFLFEIECISL
jgi:hypothetical protein